MRSRKHRSATFRCGSLLEVSPFQFSSTSRAPQHHKYRADKTRLEQKEGVSLEELFSPAETDSKFTSSRSDMTVLEVFLRCCLRNGVQTRTLTVPSGKILGTFQGQQVVSLNSKRFCSTRAKRTVVDTHFVDHFYSAALRACARAISSRFKKVTLLRFGFFSARDF